MTREDVIRMAREAGLFVGTNMAGVGLVGASWEPGKVLTHLTVEDMQRFAALVAAAEREACINACLDVFRVHLKWWASLQRSGGAYECAMAIRARGDA